MSLRDKESRLDIEARESSPGEELAEPGGPFAPGRVAATAIGLPAIRRSATSGASPDLDAARRVREARAESGSPLPDSLRAELEAALGAALDQVAIHTGERAAKAAASVKARAFAVGRDIFFAAGEYRPDSGEGRELIAHEVAHTAQAAGAPAGSELALSRPGDPVEREADAFAAGFARGERLPLRAGAAAPRLFRALDEEQTERWNALAGDATVAALRSALEAFRQFRLDPAAFSGLPSDQVESIADDVEAILNEGPEYREHFEAELGDQGPALGELASIDGRGLGGLTKVAGLLGAEIREPNHSWTLEVSATGNAYIDKVLGMIGFAAPRVTYRNDFGWDWTSELVSFSVGIEVGVEWARETDPKTGKGKGKPGGGTKPGPMSISVSGTAEAGHPAYWGYDDVSGLVSIANAGAEAKGPAGIGLKFGAGGVIDVWGDGPAGPLSFLNFQGKLETSTPSRPDEARDPPKVSVKLGTGAGVMWRIGGEVRTSDYEPELYDDVTVFPIVEVHGFATGEAELSSEQARRHLVRLRAATDKKKVQVERMAADLEEHFGVEQPWKLSIRVEGFASRVWAAAANDEERRDKNLNLSKERAQRVAEECLEVWESDGGEHDIEYEGFGGAVRSPLRSDRPFSEERDPARVQELIENERVALRHEHPEWTDEEIEERIEELLGEKSNPADARIARVVVTYSGKAIRWRRVGPVSVGEGRPMDEGGGEGPGVGGDEGGSGSGPAPDDGGGHGGAPGTGGAGGAPA